MNISVGRASRVVVSLPTSGVVAQSRRPARTAPFRRQVEQVPDRPQEIDVARVLATLGGREQELRVVEVMDLAVAAHEDIERRHLSAVFTFTAVIQVVSVGGGGEDAQVVPTALAGEIADALDRRLSDNDEVDALA